MEEKQEVVTQQPEINEEEEMALKEKKAISAFVLAMVANVGIWLLVNILGIISSIFLHFTLSK